MKKKAAVVYCSMVVTMLLLGSCGNREAEIAFGMAAETETEKNEMKSGQAADIKEVVAGEIHAQLETLSITCTCQCRLEDAITKEVTDEGGSSPSGETAGKVNINTADETLLQTLSGIGQTRAQAIIFYRENYGSFEHIEEIKNVDGIKDGVYQKIKDNIAVR